MLCLIISQCLLLSSAYLLCIDFFFGIHIFVPDKNRIVFLSRSVKHLLSHNILKQTFDIDSVRSLLNRRTGGASSRCVIPDSK